MRVLITRPEEDAHALAAALRARGHESLLEPLLRIEPAAGVPSPLDLDGVQAILFTSANGVRAFARLSQRRDLPVFAVGDASAQVARDAGFTQVASASGDVEDLARLAAARLEPGDGALYHGAGSRLAGDLKERLEGAGFTLRRVVLYQAHTASDLSQATRTALSAGKIDAVTFFSPRTAQTFVKLAQQAELAVACAALDAVCLSTAVARKLRVLPWRNVRIAARPSQDALLDCIDVVETATVERTMPEQDNPQDKDDAPGAEPAAHRIIAKFGGIRPMASKLDVAVSTVQGWRERASIPASRHGQIQAAAEAHQIDIDGGTLAASDHAPESGPAPEDDSVLKDGPAPEDQGEAAADPQAAAPSRWIPKSGGKQAGPESPQPPMADHAGNAGDHNPPNRASRGGSFTGAFLIAAFLFAIGAGTAVLTREAWMPYLPATPGGDSDAARIDDLELDLAELDAEISRTQDDNPALARIETLEGRLAEIAARPAGTGGTAELGEARAETAKLRRELTSLAARLESLDRIARASGDSEQLGAALARVEARDKNTGRDLAALRAELTALAESRGPSGGQAAMTLAVLQMRDALRGAEPFETALNTLESLNAEAQGANGATVREALAPLRPYAAGGAPSLESLQAAFPAVARAVIAQSHGGQGEGLLANALRRLSSLVSVRPLGPVEGDSAEAVVARAEAQAEAGDLASALRELDSLSGPAADAAAPWRQEAQARLTLQAALERLGALLAAGRVAG